MKIMYLMCLLSLASCMEHRTIDRKVATCNSNDEVEVQKRSTFILQCIKNANPKSDEEPEDWLRICQKIAEETICKLKTTKIHQSRRSGQLWRDV